MDGSRKLWGMQYNVSCHSLQSFSKAPAFTNAFDINGFSMGTMTIKKWTLRHTFYLWLWLALDKTRARGHLKILNNEITSTVYHWKKGCPAFRGGGQAKSLKAQYIGEER